MADGQDDQEINSCHQERDRTAIVGALMGELIESHGDISPLTPQDVFSAAEWSGYALDAIALVGKVPTALFCELREEPYFLQLPSGTELDTDERAQACALLAQNILNQLRASLLSPSEVLEEAEPIQADQAEPDGVREFITFQEQLRQALATRQATGVAEIPENIFNQVSTTAWTSGGVLESFPLASVGCVIGGKAYDVRRDRVRNLKEQFREELAIALDIFEQVEEDLRNGILVLPTLVSDEVLRRPPIYPADLLAQLKKERAQTESPCPRLDLSDQELEEVAQAALEVTRKFFESGSPSYQDAGVGFSWLQIERLPGESWAVTVRIISVTDLGKPQFIVCYQVPQQVPHALPYAIAKAMQEALEGDRYRAITDPQRDIRSLIQACLIALGITFRVDSEPFNRLLQAVERKKVPEGVALQSALGDLLGNTCEGLDPTDIKSIVRAQALDPERVAELFRTALRDLCLTGGAEAKFPASVEAGREQVAASLNLDPEMADGGVFVTKVLVQNAGERAARHALTRTTGPRQFFIVLVEYFMGHFLAARAHAVLHNINQVPEDAKAAEKVKREKEKGGS
ncbi:MAG: hypothetical protein Q8P95_04965 [bacterium]|nr:hypothetical protein [bacterium]